MNTSSRLIIVGAGSLARELASWVKSGNGKLAGYAMAGFLSADIQALAAYSQYQPGIISTVADYTPAEGDLLVMGISAPRDKLRVAAELEAKGAQFLTFVHASVIMADWVKIGRGAVICPNAVVSCHADIGDFTTINLGCTIGHDVKLGRGATLCAHVDLTGFATIGEGAFLGSHASILPRANVGEYARVGAGSVVLRSVKAGATVMGVPAKQISP
jgi:sugar O-acyltransferase (sialic acid O-acetyltransferase NeuD family)